MAGTEETVLPRLLSELQMLSAGQQRLEGQLAVLAAQSDAMKTVQRDVQIIKEYCEEGNTMAYRFHSENEGPVGGLPSVSHEAREGVSADAHVAIRKRRGSQRKSVEKETAVTFHGSQEDRCSYAFEGGPSPRDSVGSHNSKRSSQGPPVKAMATTTDLCCVLPDWPSSLKVKAELEKSADFNDGPVPRSQRSSSVEYAHHLTKTPSEIEKECYLDPNSGKMISMDVISFFALAHDVLMEPYVMALAIEEGPTLIMLAWITALYWLLNCILSFFTAYYEKGVLVTEQRNIICHYARTWFLIDIVPLLADWTHLMIIASGGDQKVKQDEGTMTVMRVTKMVRFLKLTRLVRLFRLLDKMLNLSLNRTTRVAVQVIGLVSCLVVYNHLICCAWCLIGREGLTDTSLTWLDYPAGGRSGEWGATLREMGPASQYFAAFHWTIAQMSPGPIDIVASNTAERAFNTAVLIVGLFFTSMIVSLLTGHIMHLIVLRRDQTQKLDEARRYLRQSAIRPSLAVRVQRQVTERLSGEIPVQFEAVPAFQMLSTALYRELIHEVRLPHLLRHPAFKLCAEADMTLIQLIAEETTKLTFLPAQDELFVAEAPAGFCYFVIQGQLRYTQEPLTSRVSKVSTTFVGPTAWICEVALWSQWFHVGSMQTDTPTHLLSIQADNLMMTLAKKRSTANELKAYGRSFHLRVISAMPPHSAYPSDIAVPYAEPEVLLSQHLGLELLNEAVDSGDVSYPSEIIELLREELLQEKCALQKVLDNTLERIVAVVVLKLQRDDGAILIEVGKWVESKGVSAKCELPGKKRAMNELPLSVLQRLLREDLFSVDGSISMDSTEHEVFRKDSPKYGMFTTYHRTIYHASLTHGFDESRLPLVMYSDNWADIPLQECGPVYGFETGTGKNRSISLYTWMQPDEFEGMSKERLQPWMSSLDLNQDMLCSIRLI